MRALDWRALLAGVSLAVLAHVQSLSPALADDAAISAIVMPELPPDEPLTFRGTDASEATGPALESAQSPAMPSALAPALPPAQDATAQAYPLPEPPAATLIVEEVVREAASSAKAAEVEIPPPDLPPVTVVIDVEPPRDPVALALRQQIEAERPGIPALAQLGRKDREALAALYAARDDKPFWIVDGQPSAAARALTAQLATAEEDGLDADAYLTIKVQAGAGAAELARAELSLSSAAYAYARDARGGRVDPPRLSKLLTPTLEIPAIADVLPALAQAPDAGIALASYQPVHAGYRALKAQLAAMKDSTGAAASHAAIPGGPSLKSGMKDARVPAIRERLGLPAQSGLIYDDEMADMVAEMQRSRGLKPTGRFDERTASALSGEGRTAGISPSDIIANMERWRWLPQDLGERHISVNVPDFSLALVDGDRTIHTSRVIVGKPETPTPVFSQAMQYVIVNPYWNIPPSILRKEILPGLAQDPEYAAKRGYEVIRRNGSVSVRQPPGERNALGFIKFIFPNQHSVYLHDTPSRRLFANDRRAFSHGCVRVDQPFRLAEFLLGQQGYDEERMRGMIGKGERTIKLKTQLPVHITYFTVFVDENGRLQRREDIYGYDGRVKTALGISADGRRYAHLR